MERLRFRQEWHSSRGSRGPGEEGCEGLLHADHEGGYRQAQGEAMLRHVARQSWGAHSPSSGLAWGLGSSCIPPVSGSVSLSVQQAGQDTWMRLPAAKRAGPNQGVWYAGSLSAAAATMTSHHSCYHCSLNSSHSQGPRLLTTPGWWPRASPHTQSSLTSSKLHSQPG